MLIVVIISVLFLGAVGTGFFVMWGKISSLEPPASAQADEMGNNVDEEKKEPEKIGPIFSLDPFIVNLADHEGKRYLRVTMDLELENEELNKQLKELLPRVRDSILMILPTKKQKDLSTMEGKINLREEIVSELDSFLGEGSIINLYFTEFVIQ